ncbi:MAG: glycosyltransferase [Planctomycetota bacterium]
MPHANWNLNRPRAALDELGVVEPGDFPTGLTRMDMHCHSYASNEPVNRAVGLLFSDMHECYSPPEKVYDQAKARGMDLVTITDHDQISGGIELVERGFQDFILGEEVTVFFPEDRCKLHVTVWGITPDLHDELESLGLREDVYHFAAWLAEHQIAHAFAHPLYVQNGKLRAWHLERCALLFKGWEVLNGAHASTHRRVVERYIDSLTPARLQQLGEQHRIEPLWNRAWHKATTAGSDDHGLLNIGRTWTGVVGDHKSKVISPDEFLRRVMSGRAVVGGRAGHASLLAHQLATVTAHFVAQRQPRFPEPRLHYLAAKMARFAGAVIPPPSKVALAAGELKRRLNPRRKKPLPVLASLKAHLGPVLEKYPNLKDRLDPAMWDTGAPLSQHDEMAAFVDDLCSAINEAMASGAVRSLRNRNKVQIVDHLLSYLVVHAAQLPYLFSLFYQNKERNMLEKLEHETAEPGTGVSVLERPMRVSLFTDTLGDVNGVCRFIQNVAHRALTTGRDLQVITSTGFEVPPWSNIFNLEPVFSTKMPKYEHLEIVLPPIMKILRHIDKHQPDVIHISTPGPVGLCGFVAAKMLRVPVLGVYHTDFPAYVDRLFDDHAFTKMCEAYMKFFYDPFSAIFTRSHDYVQALAKLGMPRERIVRLMPGLETSKFNRGFRDETVWEKIAAEGHRGIARESVKVLYVGRVSVEKNIPLLVNVWKKVHAELRRRGVDADLVVVGDGPYRKRMEQELKGKDAHFLGFRLGQELSTLYASADLFVFPSTTDTLGQVVMESQSSGLPVLVSDIGGPKEVVRDGETGHVLRPDDSSAWVDRLTTLICDHELRRQMGADASHSMEHFDIANSFEHFWQVHEQAWHDHLGTLGIERRDGRAGVPAASPALLTDSEPVQSAES